VAVRVLHRLALPVLPGLVPHAPRNRWVPGVGSGDAGDGTEREGDAARSGATRRPSRLRPRPGGSVLQPRARGAGCACARPPRGDGRHGDRGPIARGRARRIRRSRVRGVGGRARQPGPDTACRPRDRPDEGRGRVRGGGPPPRTAPPPPPFPPPPPPTDHPRLAGGG